MNIVEKSFKFFNTFLRLALNRRHLGVFCGVLHQYRQLGEFLISVGYGELVATLCGHMLYYANLTYNMSLKFGAEMVVYDMSGLLTLASEEGLPQKFQQSMLNSFLDLERGSYKTTIVENIIGFGALVYA